jgi:hypothetical protein
VNTVRRTFDSDFARTFPERPVPKQVVKDYRCGGFRRCGVAGSGGRQRQLPAVSARIRFDAEGVETAVLVDATNGDPSARVFEIQPIANGREVSHSAPMAVKRRTVRTTRECPPRRWVKPCSRPPAVGRHDAEGVAEFNTALVLPREKEEMPVGRHREAKVLYPAVSPPTPRGRPAGSMQLQRRPSRSSWCRAGRSPAAAKACPARSFWFPRGAAPGGQCAVRTLRAEAQKDRFDRAQQTTRRPSAKTGRGTTDQPSYQACRSSEPVRGS